MLLQWQVSPHLEMSRRLSTEDPSQGWILGMVLTVLFVGERCFKREEGKPYHNATLQNCAVNWSGNLWAMLLKCVLIEFRYF